MNLLVHNLVQCRRKSCLENNTAFPLLLQPEKLETRSVEYSEDFITNILPKIEWEGLARTLDSLKVEHTVPSSIPTETNTQFFHEMHSHLLEKEVVEGRMVCSGCQQVYPIREGIPNMLLAEDTE
ncbi:MAG: protein and tRNA methyltransferase regulatory subunit Trm112 [Amphiamblys sp. WSBS2006]|nr:MAG: protein and tRNA methyltransferase regulatory subunit Trm112 [Amphiamblys sp. WSBS2006]